MVMQGSSSRLCEVHQTRGTRPEHFDRALVRGRGLDDVNSRLPRRRETGQLRAVEADAEESSAAEEGVGGLVRAAGRGDRAAWNALVDRFASSVWAIARGHRLCHADASDVCQTTWLRLVEHLDRIEQPERVGAWLATTARRESLRIIRLSVRQVPAGDDMDDLPDRSVEAADRSELASKHVEKVLDGLLTQLPVRSQLLLRLLLADAPLSYKDISDALDMPIGSIGPTRARALDQLRRRALVAGIDLRELRTV